MYLFDIPAVFPSSSSIAGICSILSEDISRDRRSSGDSVFIAD